MKRVFLMMCVFVAIPWTSHCQGGYSSPIRIMTSVAPRCINSKKDEITIDLKRILLQKKQYLFTQDSKAGVAVLASLNGNGGAKASAPSVSTIPIKDEHAGQVSLAIEYPVADELVLTQRTVTTRNMQLDVYIEKAKGANAFGTVLNLAGQALQKLPIPDNPYTAMASSFLTFTNGAINGQVSDSSNAVQIASITLLFNDRDESDPVACAAGNFETTGAIAVLKSDSGIDGKPLLPTSNLDHTYCFKYQTTPVAELQYVAQPGAGCNALGASPTWAEVPNDYLMMIVSAAPVLGGGAPATMQPQSLIIGPGGNPFSSKTKADRAKKDRRLAMDASKSLCETLGSDAKFCGVGKTTR